MKRLFVLGSLAGFFAAACNPDVPVTAPGTYVIALFDPSNNVVPTPTILVYDAAAHQLKVPLAPGASAAQADFVAFLNSLDGYPEDTPGKATFSANLDPASISANTVLIIDGISGAAIAGASAVLTSPTQLSIVPPASGWPTGRLIAVVLLGGDNGLKGTGGTPVVGSSVWGLVRSGSPLVTNCTVLFLPDGSPNPDCQATVTVIPSTETDPAARLADQARSAVQLERLRLLYAPLLDALAGRGIPRENVALAWTFPVTTRPQVPFDPSRNIIPFPNDIVRRTVLPDGGVRVSLPIPDAGADVVALYNGLNTLDGFSTTTPIVSVFNADAVGAINQGKIDAGSLVPGAGWGFSRLAGSPLHPPTDGGVTACLDCASSDGGLPPHAQRLQFVPDVPLDERTTYGVYLTTNVTDTLGRRVIPSSAFALLRSANSLYDGTHSTVDLISDDQAAQLEQLRVALSPFVTRVANAFGGDRSNLALAWAFTTQSEVSTLAQLNGLPAVLAITDKPIYVVQGSSNTFIGEIVTPEILSGQGGTLDPLNPKPKRVPILLLDPSSSAGCTGLPSYAVTIFGHGLTRSRADAVALAGTLASAPYCQAIIATDVIWHGDRSFCAGSSRVLPAPATDDAACIVLNGMTILPGKCDTTPTSPSFGRCIAVDPARRAPCDADLVCSGLRQGLCLSDSKCEGGDFARATDTTPLISGWNILNLTNLFATRDNFRQQVVDLAQLSRVIAATGTGSLNDLLGGLGAGTLDPGRIHYAGQSLGGILGTLYTSVAPKVQHVVLNVPGGDPANILLLSLSFGPQRRAFLATLAGQGIVPGTIRFDEFIGTAKWILDPADPQNMVFSVTNGTTIPTTGRKALIQYITFDEVIPNQATEEMLNAANNRSATFQRVDECLFHPTLMDYPGTWMCPDGVCSMPTPSRHGFLLNNGPPPSMAQAQAQLATYVSSDTLLPCPP